MSIYFKTARSCADKHDRQFNGAGKVCFSARGWQEFSDWIEGEAPQVRDLLVRYNGPVDNHPEHDVLTIDGKPLGLAFTADECRRLFGAIAAVSEGGMRKERDFWEFASLVAAGIIEDGLSWT
jgi:hypothetical protein